MGLFDFIFNSKKKEQERLRLEEEARRQKLEQERIARERKCHLEENDSKKGYTAQIGNAGLGSNWLCKEQLEEIIRSLAKLSYMFRDSVLLTQTGRNTSMMSRLYSYTGMMGYLYEYEYKYGSFNSLVDTNIANHFKLVLVAMSNPSHRNKSIAELAGNWSDVLQVIFTLSLEDNPDKVNFEKISDEVTIITRTFERLSGNKCKQSSDPKNVTPRKVTYNPLNITEDLQLSQGHIIPDITNVFAQELIPQLTSPYSTKTSKDIVAEYALAMIKSYYDNAGFVPMVIVDQITGQINQVTEKVQRISYSPYPSLKEYVLSKIYK